MVRLKSLNRRTVDVIASRLYFYYSYSYELTGDLAEIRGCVWFLSMQLKKGYSGADFYIVKTLRGDLYLIEM